MIMALAIDQGKPGSKAIVMDSGRRHPCAHRRTSRLTYLAADEVEQDPWQLLASTPGVRRSAGAGQAA
jgi:glycerol kinase